MNNALMMGSVLIEIVRKKIGKGTVGKYSFRKSTITIDPSVKGFAARQVLGHEIGHQWMDRAGITHRMSDKEKEQMADIIGWGLAELVYENGERLIAIFDEVGL